MNPQTINLGNTEIRILSTVKGLVSESQIVENEIEAFNPDLVALGMGPEEVNGTREWDGEPYDMSGWDEIYGLSLRKIVGDKGVKLPPPSFSTAIKVSDSKETDVIGIDMDEISFTEAYTKNISTWQLFKRGRLEKSMTKSGIEGQTPEEIALNMESSIRELSGFSKLESERVKAMASNLLIQTDSRDKILAIIEISNVSDLLKELKQET
ncbi:MAG: hypothetical protein BEU00_02980 [Marine Group III euryarchaeote CG-Epi3]|uniref:Uncharacterized protein n=1 Tax=Marine Group III euryarchaeote CG-Epi3 TaxID=1888997 RepID=A0A1J5U4U6_9ARCH|nr:MAG: hypothetical protein BEU00_02980 [Marine Group III euryarchaeote CG-Epi3]